MAVEFGWRRFIFFDKSFVMDTSTGEKFVGLKDVSADSWCKLGETVFLGERRGGIFRLNQQFQDFFWKPFQRSLVDLKCSQGLLFSAGEDDDTGSLLKIWHKVTEDKSELFKSVRFSSISAGLATAATAIGVHSSLTEVVAGFGDGSVLMFQGDVIKDKMDKTSRWLKLCDHNSGDGPVEGIAVSHLPGDKTVVFVIYTKALYSYVIENRVVSNRMKHFSSGANRDCWAFNERLGQLAIANKEMVYLYDAERSMETDGGHGRCYKLGGGYEKMQLVWFGEYLVLLTKQQAIIAAADEKFMSVVTIYDIKTQYVAFSCSLPAICRMFVLGSNLMVLNDRDGTLSELKEKTLAAKLEILYKKQFFDVALSLAKSSKEAKQHEQAIHCKFADHLYAKGDFDNAIDHYKGTIGMLEPSYVMKKFHDESRLHQLCVYLEALHEKNVYNRHQTEILLQTYARLGDNDKLLSFVEKMAHFPDADLPTAFQILRSAGLSKKASFLAIKLKLPQEALACMIEDEHHYRGAIKYIDNLSTEIAVQMLEKHGKVLLEHSPKEAIPLLEKTLKEAADSNLELAQFLAPYYDQLAFDSDFVQFLLKLPSSKTQVVIDRLLEIRLRKLENAEEITDATDRELFQLADAATPEVALQLVRIFRCSTIEKHVMQSNNWWKELAKFLLKHGEINELIEICKIKNDAQMWQETMICIAQRKDITEYDLRMFLQEVERSESLHPLLVLEVLSGSETIKISAVKPYIINWLKRQNEQIEKNTKAVEDAENRMREITQQAESLKFEPQVIQVSKCSACDTALQLPAVHFLCHHSYHVHCFESYSDRADHCPACVSPATVVQSDSTDNFFNSGYGKMQDQLNSSVNGMEIVAQFIRRGLFNNQKKLAPRQSIGSNPFASTRQNSDSGSSQAEPAMARRPTRSNNPFEELPSPRRNTNNPFDGPDQTKPKGSNPFESSNPFDE